MGKKPPPFKRNSIEMGRHGRCWQDIRAKNLQPGDVVQSRGLVESVEFKTTTRGNVVLDVEFWSREVIPYSPDALVHAFVKPLTDTDE